MKHGRSLAATLPAALILAVPAMAAAKCAQRPLDQIAREVPVVVTAKAQPGPVAQRGIGLLSPAAFSVVAYDQGDGPREIKVLTALTNGPSGLTAVSEGVNPAAGQTWRLWGTVGADGVLQTSVCLGSSLVGAQRAPTMTAGRRTTTLRAATLAGVARGGSLPTVTVARRAKNVLLQVPAREANLPVSPSLANSLVAVRVTRGGTTTTVAAHWSAKDGLLAAKIPAPARGASTVTVITRAASYAVRLRAG